MKFIVEFINFIQNIAFILHDEVPEMVVLILFCHTTTKKNSYFSCTVSNSNATGVFCTLFEYLISKQKSPMTVGRTSVALATENGKCNVVFE